MSGRFFITGLPRSRTAWFSVATTTATSVCYHEPVARLQSYVELREFWAPKFGIDIGVSDSGLALYAPEILADLNPRTLIIERSLDDVIASFLAYAKHTSIVVDEARSRKFAQRCLDALDRIKSHPQVKTASFESLDDYATMLCAMRWLLPGRDFPDLRELMRMNIQLSHREIEREVGLPHTKWHLAA